MSAPPCLVLRFSTNNDNDSDDTDDEMPPLLMRGESFALGSSTSSGSPAAASNDDDTASFRAVNRIEDQAMLPMPASHKANKNNMETNPMLDLNSTYPNGMGDDSKADEGDQEKEGKRNNNRFAPLQDSTSEDDEDDHEEESEDDFSSSGENSEDDEVHYYDDDDDDDDDEEDEDDDYDENSHNGRGMPAGLMDFFRAMTNVVENHHAPNDHDDDDDDDSDCNCPRCWMTRFGLSEDDDMNLDDDDGDVLDPMASPCAICMEPETTKRKFVNLPCCGGTLVESTTSTRFCQQCVIQYMARTGNGVPEDMCSSSSKNSNLVGECPRCKRLLVLKGSKPTRSQKKKKIPFYQRTQLVPANAHQYHWYIASVDGGSYRVYLLTLAWCDPSFVPEELLLHDSSSADRIEHLCQWGILEKVKMPPNNCGRWPTTDLADKWHGLLHRLLPSVVVDPNSAYQPNQSGAVYKVSPALQMELRNLLVKHLEMDDDLGLRLSRMELEEPGYVGHQSFTVAGNYVASAFMAISKLRVGRALLLLNRGLTLALCSFKPLLPNLAQWPSDLPTHNKCWHVATALNLILVYFLFQILVQALWIALYLFQAFCLCQLVGAFFAPPEQTWKRWIRNTTLFGLLVYTVLMPLVVWYRPWTAAGEVSSSSIPTDESLELILAKTAHLVVGQEL